MRGDTRTLIDAVVGGAFMSKSANEAHDLIEEMALNNYLWPTKRENKKVAGILEVDPITIITAQIASLTKQVENSMSTQAIQTQPGPMICSTCGGPHPVDQCPTTNPMPFKADDIPLEQANVIGNFRQPNNPYSNTYNPRYKNHPNFSCSNNEPQNPPYQPPKNPQYPRYRPFYGLNQNQKATMPQHPPPPYQQPKPQIANGSLS